MFRIVLTAAIALISTITFGFSPAPVRIVKIEMILEMGASSTYHVTFAGTPEASDLKRAERHVRGLVIDEFQLKELLIDGGSPQENVALTVHAPKAVEGKERTYEVRAVLSGGRFDYTKGLLK